MGRNCIIGMCGEEAAYCEMHVSSCVTGDAQDREDARCDRQIAAANARCVARMAHEIAIDMGGDKFTQGEDENNWKLCLEYASLALRQLRAAQAALEGE